MIGKISKGSYIKGLLNYHYAKIESGEAELITTNIYSDQKNDQLQFFLNTFSMHNNSRTKDYLLHASLNFSPEERLDQTKLSNIANEYLDRMGYRDVPFTVFVHNDKAHQHIHIVASRINYEGQIDPVKHKKTMDIRINMEQCKIIERKYDLVIAESKTRSQRRQENLNEINLQKYAVSNALRLAIKNESPFLKQFTLPEHIHTSMYDHQINDLELKKLLKSDYKPLVNQLEENGMINYSKRHLLTNQLQKAYSKAESASDYFLELESKGIYARILTDGRTKKNYICYGNSGEAYYLTEKHVPERFSFNHIKDIEKNRQSSIDSFNHDIQKRSLNKSLTSILSSSSNEMELEANLRMKGINFEYVYTAKGSKIQGIRFLDTKADNPIWLNGSEIHRNFSWNNIEKKMSPIQSQVEAKKKLSKSFKVETKISTKNPNFKGKNNRDK